MSSRPAPVDNERGRGDVGQRGRTTLHLTINANVQRTGWDGGSSRLRRVTRNRLTRFRGGAVSAQRLRQARSQHKTMASGTLWRKVVAKREDTEGGDQGDQRAARPVLLPP